jgi:ubiquitin-conjugating enzyme E2 Z
MSNTPSQQENKDLELARKLQEEFEKELPPVQNDHEKKLQEELDFQLAMNLQHEDYSWAVPPPILHPPKLTPRLFQKNEPKLPPTSEAINRIIADYQELLKSNNPLIHASIDEEDVTHVEALIIGPPDTPYEGGFFHFDMVFPSNYPWSPPKVTLQTTDNGRVRFNPNLYANGKVCLSILGTWTGPSWTSIQTMLSTLISIQSLMNPMPYHNEPGYETERHPGDAKAYNECIQHETLRVAVCGMLEHPTCKVQAFEEVMEEFFIKNYEKYVKIAEEKAPLLDGKPMNDPFGEARGYFNYKGILSRLENLKKKIEEKRKKRPIETLQNQAEVTVELPALKKVRMGSSDADDETEPTTNNPPVSSTAVQCSAAPNPISVNPNTATELQSQSPTESRSCIVPQSQSQSQTQTQLQSQPQTQPQPEAEHAKSLPSPEKKDSMMVSPPYSPSHIPINVAASDTSHDVTMTEMNPVTKSSLSEANFYDHLLSIPQPEVSTGGSVHSVSAEHKMEIESHHSQSQTPQQPAAAPQSVDSKIVNAGAQLFQSMLNAVQQANVQLQVTTGTSYDEELAFALQQQLYNEIAAEESFDAPEDEVTYRPNRLKIKPPPLSELKTSTVDDPNSEIKCIICRQSLDEYIILPNCAQPHIYCMSCAQKTMKNTTPEQYPPPPYKLPFLRRKKNQSLPSQQHITCVLCKSVTYFDEKNGIEALKRRKRPQVSELTPDFCPKHKTEHIMFCLKSMQLVCPECLVSSEHNRHNDEDHKAIEDAVTDVDRKITRQMVVLQEKLHKFDEFVASVNNQKEKISQSVQDVKKEVKDKLEELKKLIEEKINELNKQIDTVQSNKERNLESEIGKANKKIEAIQKVLEQAKNVQKLKSNPIDFLSTIENCDEDLRTAALILEPKVELQWFRMPQLRLHGIEEMLKSLKYRDNRYGELAWSEEYYDDYGGDEDTE